MALLDQTRHVERQRFFDGQRLFAQDLQDLDDLNQEMRWLHNASLHQPGIGNGFAVHGDKGDRKVTVGSGYAIDVLGREIVLIESQELDVPPVSGGKNGEPVYYDLVVSYPDDDALEVTETREGVCAVGGAVRLREQPVFCWVRLAQTDTGLKTVAGSAGKASGGPTKQTAVPVDGRLAQEVAGGLRLIVARALVQNCQLKDVLSTAERRSARPALGPHVAADTYVPPEWQPYWWGMEDDLRDALFSFIQAIVNNTATSFNPAMAAAAFMGTFSPASVFMGREAWLAALGPVVLPLGLEVTVPTGAACFLTAPHVMTRLGGQRIGTFDFIAFLERIGAVDFSAWTPGEIEVVKGSRDALRWDLYWDGVISIADPQPGRFTARVAVTVQLLDIPQIMKQRAMVELLRGHDVVKQFRKGPIGRKIDECRDAADEEQCILEVVDMIMALVEDTFLGLLRPLGWNVVWMGVEG